MDVRPLDLADEAEVQQFYDVSWRAEMGDGRPWNGHWTHDELVASLREPVGDQRMEGFSVFDGATIVGAGVVGFSSLANLDKAWVFPMVDPPRRRQGHGSALLAGLLHRCGELGRTTVSMGSVYAGPEDEDAPAMRFARSNGFHLSYTEITRRLALPVDEALLDRVDTEGSAHREGYDLESYVDEIPDHLLESYCGLVNQLGVDAPSGEVDYEESAMTPEACRQRFAQNRKVGRRVFYALAVRDGDAVAYSDLCVAPSGDKAWQWGTFVGRGHRGHRLGAAVKVVNLRAIQRDAPEVTEIVTENAETNQFMVSINDLLGFEVIAVGPSFVRRLDA